MTNKPRSVNDLSPKGVNFDKPTGNVPGSSVSKKSEPQSIYSFYNLSSDGVAGLRADRTVVSNDLMFRFPKLLSKNFRNSLGYNLVIYDAEKDNKVVSRLDFPLNPTNISINVPHATSLVVTMKGISEDMNGAPLHSIRISGTTGVALPHAAPGSGPGGSELKRSLEYAFKNTIKAAENVTKQFNKIKKTFADEKEYTKLNYVPTGAENAETSPYPVYTGYSFAHNLVRFLDFYMSLKKNKKNRGLRLMFSMFKDGGFYTCTLNNYSLTKSAGTLEYNYNIDLTAWRKHALPVDSANRAKKTISVSKYKIPKFAQALNGIRQSRRAIASVHGVLRGIRGDIEQSFIQPCAEVTLLLKDTIGLARTLWDFCNSGGIVDQMKESWKQNVTENFDQASAEYAQLEGLVKAGQGGLSEESLKESLQSKIESGRPETVNKQGDSSDPVDEVMRNIADYPALFDGTAIEAYRTSPEAQQLIDEEMERIRRIDADGLRERRDKISNFAASISEAFGGTSATYNRINDINVSRTYVKKLSVADIELLNNLNNIVMSIDKIIIETENQQLSNGEDYYSYYIDYAVSNGLALSANNVSKFMVPFQSGGSLESLALQYLGSPDRWPEIAALNALRAPYVDETGFELPVTGSGGGNTLNVSNVSNLYIGQVVKISSKTQPTIIRKIRSLSILSSAEAIIAFEPASDNILLTSYKQSDEAKITAYLPGTINSNMLIAIPSEIPSSVDSALKTTPGLEEMNGLARIAKIDFLLDIQGDIIFTSAGDIQLATGLTNLIQAAKLKLLTKTSTLLQHPDFGTPLEAGISTAEIDADDSLEKLRTSFAEDPRFSGILAATFNKSGPAMTVSILLGIAGSDTNLPISVQSPI